uniref:Reverse transcriptase domain-containing protein n=1 Tax=Tanacetum cinerariifolium TaxID=118510 RepID=A0A6L2J6T9_TANCI|nr:reverse transcriptase domain-containing protein [Tanacetum cinerariifolium]
MRQGYYWPTMYRDTKEDIEKCNSCQMHASVPRLSKTSLTSIMSPWPFYQWGLDILGPLSKGLGKLKFIIVAIDYFTMWMEAKPLAKSTALGCLLEEIHMTWVHLKKKRTRLRLYTKYLEEIIIQTVEKSSPTLATASELDQDGVRNITMASEDEYPMRTLGDYSKPSHKGYRNTIELPVGKNVVPLRSDTIRNETGTPQPQNAFIHLSIVIISKEIKAKEEWCVKPNAAEYTDHKRVVEVKEEAEDESKEEFTKETEEETKEEEEENDPKYFDTFPTINELGYHEWILKNPRTLWVSAKIRTGNMDNIKNQMHGLKLRRKSSNPKKIANFIGKVKVLKVFVGNLSYECNFVVLKDSTSVIDHYLGECILQEVTNRTACRNFFQKNECEIFIEARDGVRIILDGVRLYLMRRSLKVLMKFPDDDSWMTI